MPDDVHSDALQRALADRYAVERELGRGGMGAVYLARDRRLDRPVALKVLPTEYAMVPMLRERFLRETRLAAGFSHPNVVPVYAVEEAGDVLAYVMAFIEGETLAERVRRGGPLSARETLRMLTDVGYALAFAHGRGVVHRDIKPDNIMIERATGRALVMDFGVARTITAAPANDGLTRVGEVVGTPEYMSPEQATGDVVDGRSDLYALGLTAYFALTGKIAMAAESTGKVLARQLTEMLPPIGSLRPDLPPALAAAIDHCLAKDPAERFPDAESLIAALEAAQLAAPEIPLPVRLFAQELSKLSMVVVFMALFAVYMIPRILEGGGINIDASLPVMVLLAVLLTRVAQTLNEARHLAVSGFGAAEVHRGLLAVVGERDARRDELRADPAVRRARRRALAWAAVLLVGAVGMVRAFLLFRRQVGPHQYETALPGIALVVSGFMLFGVSLVLFLRSPFKMPLGERFFRWVWIGPFGRAFVGFAGRRVPPVGATPSVARSRPASGVTGVPAAGVPVKAPALDVSARARDPITALEARVTELERWRHEATRG